MKTFKEYLFESAKTFAFKVKIAGELPENFQENLKSRLSRCGVKTIAEIAKTPIQKVPLDFPELENVEVRVFDVVCEYPITSPEISKDLTEMGVQPACFRVRGAGEPSEEEQMQMQEEPSGVALLQDSTYSETEKVKHKDYFGNDFNNAFLKDLAKTSKARHKELGHDKGKPDVLGSAPKVKADKSGSKSPMGS